MPTLVSAASDAQKVFLGSTGLLNAVYTAVDPIEGYPYKTLNIPIPARAVATNVAAGDFNFNDLSDTNQPVTLDTNIETGFVIRSFEQWTSPDLLRTVFLDAAVKSCIRKVDDTIAAVITTGNFTNATVANTGGTTNVFSVANFLTARTALANAGVPVDDLANMSFVQPETAYQAMLGDTAWTAATSVGSALAGNIRESGSIPIAFSTHLSADLSLGTLTTGSASAHIYTGALLHRYAIVVASAKMPAPRPSEVVDFVDMIIAGLPFRIMVSYSHTKAAWLVSVNCGLGVAPMRPEALNICLIKQTP